MAFISGLASGIDTDQLISQLMAIERRPLVLMQRQIDTLKSRSDVYRDVNTRLNNLLSTVEKLLSLAAFESKTAQSSNESVLTATADTSAAPGSYELTVQQLARIHRIASDAVADVDAALGLSGTVQINGVSVDITVDMSLADIRDAINGAEAGVRATIIENMLILESEETGASNAIQLVDAGGALTVSAGSDTPAVVTATADASAQAGVHAVTVTQLATHHQVVGANFVASDVNSLGWTGTFAINGTEITVTVGDSLSTIRDKINASGAGVSATVDTVGGQYRLVLTSDTPGSGGAMTLEDVTGDLLTNDGRLNFLQGDGSFENETIAAQDAEFTVDGVDYIRGSNTVSDVVAGVTFNLVSAGSATVTVTRTGGGGPLTDLGLLDANDGFKNELQAAQDARFTVNGLVVTRESNTVNDLITGVTFNLAAPGSATVTVERDVDDAIDAIEAFVAQYNSVQDFIAEKTAKEAILQGDPTLIRLRSTLQVRATDLVAVPDDWEYDSLSVLGITVDRTGVMSVDEAKLRQALENDPDQVRKLFAAEADEDGFDGVAVRLQSYIETYTTSGTGILSTREQMYQSQMESLEEAMERMEDRLAIREQNLRRQFTEMEKALSSLQAMSAALAGQLAQLGVFGTE